MAPLFNHLLLSLLSFFLISQAVYNAKLKIYSLIPYANDQGLYILLIGIRLVVTRVVQRLI